MLCQRTMLLKCDVLVISLRGSAGAGGRFQGTQHPQASPGNPETGAGDWDGREAGLGMGVCVLEASWNGSPCRRPGPRFQEMDHG